jgi:hypothetical protein
MPEAGSDFEAVWKALPEPRMAPYAKIAQDKRHALALYARYVTLHALETAKTTADLRVLG